MATVTNRTRTQARETNKKSGNDKSKVIGEYIHDKEVESVDQEFRAQAKYKNKPLCARVEIERDAKC